MKEKIKKKSILIISYDFYPDSFPNTYRWFSIAKEWASKGVIVYVITADKNKHNRYEEVEGIKVFRTSEGFVGNVKYKYNGKFNSFDLMEKRSSKISSLKKILRNFYNMTWAKLYWPDHSFLWYFSARKMAKEIISENQIDYMISVSWTFTAHLIAYSIKRNFFHIKWLADTVDPFSLGSGLNNNKLYSKANKEAELMVFSKADINTVLTENIRNKYLKWFTHLDKPIFVVPNIFIPFEFDFSSSLENEFVSMVFFGTLSKDVRSPLNTLELLNNLIHKHPDFNIRCDFYGDINDCGEIFELYPKLLNKVVFLKGRVDREEIPKIMKDSNILLNIGNSNEYQEPSKLIEYMFSRKKILNVSSIKNDTSAALLKCYKMSFNVFGDNVKSADVLERLVTFAKDDMTISKLEVDSILNDYYIENVSSKYWELIK